MECSVSGLMHPQYPLPDIKHLLDRLHTKDALRFLDLEIAGPTRSCPGVYCEAANAHTEGSMNVMVETAEGLANICGDVIYDFQDQIVEPVHQIHDRAAHDRQPRLETLGESGDQAPAERLQVPCCRSTTGRR